MDDNSSLPRDLSLRDRFDQSWAPRFTDVWTFLANALVERPIGSRGVSGHYTFAVVSLTVRLHYGGTYGSLIFNPLGSFETTR